MGGGGNGSTLWRGMGEEWGVVIEVRGECQGRGNVGSLKPPSAAIHNSQPPK